jgi:hypothetical protein
MRLGKINIRFQIKIASALRYRQDFYVSFYWKLMWKSDDVARLISNLLRKFGQKSKFNQISNKFTQMIIEQFEKSI